MTVRSAKCLLPSIKAGQGRWKARTSKQRLVEVVTYFLGREIEQVLQPGSEKGVVSTGSGWDRAAGSNGVV